MIRVALADDHRMVRQALRRVLESKGFEVVGECEDGLSVIDCVAASKPDVLVLDLALPGLHGLDVLSRVVSRHQRTKVLVLSGDGRERFVLAAVRGGASGYVLKGGDVMELVAAIETLARGGRYVSASLADYLVQAVARPDAAVPSDPYETLTPREREVFLLVALGLSNHEVGAKLFVSPRTAETHRANIMRKLHLRTATDAALFAVRRGLVSVAF